MKNILLVPVAFTSLVLAGQKREVSDCPGVYFAQESSTGCCVGGTMQPLTLSSCAGWPACTGPVTVTTTRTPISCATIITAGDDYTEEVQEASRSLAASGTSYVTTIDDVLTETGTEAAASTQASATVSSATSTASGLSSATSNAGVEGSYLGVGAIHGAALALALLL